MGRFRLPKRSITERRISENGYVLNKLESGQEEYEHRQVAERILERRLEKWEVVHHINGRRNDNRPSNLCVMHHLDHDRYHDWYDSLKASRKYPRRETQLRKLKEDFNGKLLGEFVKPRSAAFAPKADRDVNAPNSYKLLFGVFIFLGIVLAFAASFHETGPISTIPTETKFRKPRPLSAADKKRDAEALRTRDFNRCTAQCYKDNREDNERDKCIQLCQGKLPE